MSETPFPSIEARLNARINWERRDRSGGWRVDLDPVRELLEQLGRPQDGLRFVHVAGSKGKGSVSSLVTHALVAAGETVGTYGSPHVESITERIRIDGVPIEDVALAVALAEVLDAVESAEAAGDVAGEASWFDIMTAAALVSFRACGAQWAVMEVGLGGRLDSTNVIPSPEVAVVTTIALEHTEVLGKTLGAIATEKGGIVKAGCHLVTGCAPDSEAGEVLAKIAAQRGVAAHRVAWDPADQTFQEINVRLAEAVLDALRDRGVAHASLNARLIAAAQLPGRMETLSSGGVPIVVDGAHVPSSVEMALAEARASHPGPFWVVVAVHKEKNAADLAAPFLPLAEGVIATTVPGTGVHRSASDLALDLAQGEPRNPVSTIEAPVEAFTEAVRAAGEAEGGWVFVTGSLYLVGAIRGLTD